VLLINAVSAGISAGLILQIFNEDYDLIVIKTLERVYKNYYYIIRGLIMRLDKYLKVSRLIKRRTVANDACDAGRVMINDKVAKASVDVKVGDIIDISFGNKNVKVRVTDVKDTVKKEEAKEMFEYI
jgi:ribosomal 50S subunit-recycling heat shock protein